MSIAEVTQESWGRFILHRRSAEGAGSSFASDVAAGLTAPRKYLLPKYLYDELGSHLFEAICVLPEYYLTRAETEILTRRADEIVTVLGGPMRLLELGSGSSAKTCGLIEALLRRQGDLHYLPIDISPSALERSSKELLDLYPSLSISAFVGEFNQGLAAFGDKLYQKDNAVQTLALFLGSTIGNVDPGEAHELLCQLRRSLERGDAFLLGADLRKPSSVLIPAYDDSLGVTAAFNLNLLKLINQELGGTFDLRRFKHLAIYNREEERIEMHLVSRREQRVIISALGLEVHFAKGETIHTENSYKFSPKQLSDLAQSSGFELAHTWLDDRDYFSLNLLMAS